jgi:NAD(P)-dependent dehydrogenase (short-subunit alcohol dehydrogenase family)
MRWIANAMENEGPATPRLDGRVAIVTGGASGLGLTTAEACLAAGARVAIVDRDTEALTQAEAELRPSEDAWLAIAADIRTETEVEAAVERVRAAWGSIDVLVNSAALLSGFIQGDAPERPSFWEVDAARWRELWDVNVTGLWLCTRQVARCMIAAGRGSIVNLTSTVQTMASESHIPYGPSKAAVDAFTRAGAAQLKPHGVRMNALSPGGIVNPRGSTNPRFSPADVIVPAALFLASDRSVRVTGQSVIAEEYNREQGLLPAGSPRAD